MFVAEHYPNHKGNVAELAIAKEAASLGLSVLAPLTEHERYDLILGVGDRLLRVQCKWGRMEGDVVTAKLTRSRRGPDGFIREKYSASEVDAFGIYCGDLDECFLVPIDAVSGQWSMQLRLQPTRNGQRASLHLAEKYRLGAVAQLEERSDGIRKVGGSSPPSSTQVLALEEVGAHEFRNHFGFYMERAAAGIEVLVSRRGKPHVHLGPARSRPFGLACDASQEPAEPAFVEPRGDVPGFAVPGLRRSVEAHPTGQLGGEVVAGRDRHDLVLGAVEEQDRQMEVLAVLEGIEAVPVCVDPGADRPLERQRGKCREPHLGRVSSRVRFQSSTGASSTRPSTREASGDFCMNWVTSAPPIE